MIVCVNGVEKVLSVKEIEKLVKNGYKLYDMCGYKMLFK